MKALADAVVRGDQNAAVEITRAALEEGTVAKSVLDEGLIAGMDVIDVGVDVGHEKFVEQVKAADVHVVGMSALLTTTMPGMEKTLKALKEVGVTAKVMLGMLPNIYRGYI